MYTIATNDPYLSIEMDHYNGHSRETRAGIRQRLRRGLITERIVYRHDGVSERFIYRSRNPGVSARQRKKLALLRINY